MDTFRKKQKEVNFVAIGMILLLVLALLVLTLPGPALAQTCSRNYTVASGDTISNIAETFNVTVQQLATANSLTTPYTIYIGQVLCIPATSSTSTSTSTSSSSSSSSTSSSPTLELSIIGNKILLEGSHFPGQNTYYVRIGEKNSTKSQKLGRVRSLKDGLVDGFFLLPKGLRQARVIEVCLKNVENDDLFCERLTQPK
jgi:LysM repeat protein